MSELYPSNALILHGHAEIMKYVSSRLENISQVSLVNKLVINIFQHVRINFFLYLEVAVYCYKHQWNTKLLHFTVEPRYNEVPRDWQNMFAITRFRCIEVLFHWYIWLLLGWRISFVIPTTSSHRGSTVIFFCFERCNLFFSYCNGGLCARVKITSYFYMWRISCFCVKAHLTFHWFI